MTSVLFVIFVDPAQKCSWWYHQTKKKDHLRLLFYEEKMLKNEFGGFFSIFVNYESLHKFRIGHGKRSPIQSRIRSETDGHWHALVKKVMRKSEAHEINGKLTICLLFWVLPFITLLVQFLLSSV